MIVVASIRYTEEVGLNSKHMDEHLNNNDEMIDEESVMVNLHTIISAAHHNQNLFQMESFFWWK